MEEDELVPNASASMEVSRQSEPELRFPDTALRLIFRALEFSDVKNCRLVSKQWHRHALDHVNFVLSAVHLGPTRRSQRINAPVDINRHRNRMTLVPYSTTLDEEAVADIIDRTTSKQPAKKAIFFNEMPSILKSLHHKIRHVVIKDIRPTLFPVLEMLSEMLPAAKDIFCTHEEVPGDVDIWSEFERKPRRQAAANDGKRKMGSEAMACRFLLVREEDVETNSVVSRIFSRDAQFINEIIAEDWWCLQQLLNDHKRSNNDERLVLEQCRDLWLQEESSRPTDSLFPKLSQHFANVEELECSIGVNDSAADIEHLEQLRKLSTLTINSEWAFWGPKQVLPKLCLPSLTELHLEPGILLPENPRHFNSSGLAVLDVCAHMENMQRLSAHVQIGSKNLAKLENLTLVDARPHRIEPHLRRILAAARNLKTLEAIGGSLSIAQLPMLTTIGNVVAEVSPGLAAIEVGHFEIPDGCDCRGLVAQLVGDVKQRGLKAAITIDFDDNDNEEMANALTEAGVGGDNVTASELVDDADFENCKCCELTWHNDATGTQQQLRIRVCNDDDDDDDDDEDDDEEFI